jgi:ATP-dependent Lon protease
MEMIDIPGYTDDDKLRIAQRYLVPRQMREHGLSPAQVRWEPQALRRVIEHYTREAGVRELERRIGAVCRGVAARVAEGREQRVATVDEKRVASVLGPEQYVREAAEKRRIPGVVTGLAYTPVGGEVLFIEAAKYAGKGELKLTGQIGQVMKESAHAAMTLVRTRAGRLGIDARHFSQYDLHLHVPAGAVPKDGPSAGVAMFTAIASIFSDKPVRGDLAMTGEITLRGLVLPIGGLKEKTLAAARLGIRTVVVPKGNRKDLPDVAPEVRRKLKFVFAENVDQVLAAAVG